MNDLKITAKIFYYLTALSFCLWIGGYVGKLLTIFRLFEPETMALKSYFQVSELSQAMSLLLPLIIYNLITYAASLICFLVFLVTSKFNLKNEGWLFIITVIILITLPFEVYLSKLDYNFVIKVLSNNYNVNEIIEILRQRIIKLGSFPLIEVFAYFAALSLFLFKPFRKTL
ncbi:hypothetical protein ABRY23_02485 [Melioribacteraceae bacterium 4301-Me]|uniref:hypothetical protein n=1 Tax=Pyranulibacter aquaticus TaxID=3163344 RepID=UPI00359B1356